MISLPLVSDNNVFGLLNIYAEKADSFELSEVKLFAGNADDLVYGVKALRAREEHKRVEEALKRSEERIRASIENMPDAFSIVYGDQDETRPESGIYRIDYANRRGRCRLTGLDSSELAGGNLFGTSP